MDLITGRHKNFYVAVSLGLLVGIVTAFISRDLALVSAVNVFFLTYLTLTGRASRKLSAQFLREHAAEEDAPAVFI